MKFMQAGRLKHAWPWIGIALLLLVGLIALARPALSSDLAAAVNNDLQDTQAHVVPTDTSSQPESQLTTASDSISETAEQTAPTVAALPSSDNCIACHTDKEQLKALAEEPEEVKSAEAEGEG